MKNTQSFDQKVHRFGRLSSFFIILAMLFVPLSLMLRYQISIDYALTFDALIDVLAIFGTIGVIDFFSFAPLLGAGGQYISFVSGNVGNLKAPASVNALKIAGFKPNSKEGTILSILATASSTLVTTVILFIGMLFLQSIYPLINSDFLKPGFDQIIYAIMGATFMPLFMESPKEKLFPFLFLATITFTKGLDWIGDNQKILMPLTLLLTFTYQLVLNQAENKKEDV